MPFLLNTPQVPTEPMRSYSAMHIRELNVDLISRRIVVVVMFGQMQGEDFVTNRNVPEKRYVLEGATFNRVASMAPVLQQSLYDNVKHIVWTELRNFINNEGSIT